MEALGWIIGMKQRDEALGWNKGMGPFNINIITIIFSGVSLWFCIWQVFLYNHMLFQFSYFI